jgi:hypothetical protein
MPFPFVTRSQYQDAIDQREQRIAELKERLAATEHELSRIKDGVFQEHFGFQLHDTIPPKAVDVEPEIILTPAEQAEEDEAASQRNATNRLRSKMKTSPSQLGSALTREMQRSPAFMARAKNPSVAKMFDTAKLQALNKA